MFRLRLHQIARGKDGFLHYSGNIMKTIFVLSYLFFNLFAYTYQSCFIKEDADTSQIFLRDANVLPKRLSYEEYWKRE
jgi:hypothetical protein